MSRHANCITIRPGSRVLPGFLRAQPAAAGQKMCGSSGRVCLGGELSHEGWNAGQKAAIRLHNFVNCTAFMLKTLLAMWKNGFHNKALELLKK